MINRRLTAALAIGALPFAAGAQELDSELTAHLPEGQPVEGVLRVAAEYDDSQIRIHYKFETDDPSWMHQMLRFEDGEWVRYGAGSGGPDAHGHYEDRISMLLDDGSVDHFDLYGGWMTSHEGIRTTASEVSSDAVEAHPHLGETLGRSDARKFLPQSRDVEDDAETNWDAVRDTEELEQLQADGVFLDLWQWRAHRSHPMGVADNGYVLEYRLASSGSSMFTNNWDGDAEQPAWMFDEEQTGLVALDWDAVVAGDYGQDDPYFISEDNAVPFDPDRDWQEGDTIPQRFLQEPEGSRGAIAAEGGWEDGAWRITLTRTLEAPDPMDSKTLEDGGVYDVAFAVHTGGVGARWHLVSIPETLGLGVEGATITAQHSDTRLSDDELDWVELPLVYPGQVNWQSLHSQDHPGQDDILEREEGLQDFHALDLDLEDFRRFVLEHDRALTED